MALSDDQRAMLRLLAQREQGYEDMAALMGVSVEELRGRVKEALSELEKEGEEPPQLPPEPQSAPEEKGPEPEPKPEKPVAPSRPPSPKSRLSILDSKGARIGIAAVAAAIVVVVVLLVLLGGGSSDSSSTTTSAEAPSGTGGGSVVAEATEAAESGANQKEVTKAVLSPEDGSEAHGIAVFGRVKNKLALQIVAEGLEQLPKGQSYAIWIAASPTKMLPLAASPVNNKGQIASQFEVPTELLAYLANETFNEVAVTKASISQLNATLKAATKSRQPPSYTGSPVLRGTITGPIIGAAKRLEEEESKGK